MIPNKRGLHLRAAGRFTQVASHFQCDIWVKKDDVEVNGKSIMGLLSLAACLGSEISLRTLGEDAEEAMAKLCALIEDKFEEGE